MVIRTDFGDFLYDAKRLSQVADFMEKHGIDELQFGDRYGKILVENKSAIGLVMPKYFGGDDIKDVEAFGYDIRTDKRGERFSLPEIKDIHAMSKEEISRYKSVGKGVFGERYDQFRGNPYQAAAFLMGKKSGEAIGVFNRPELGDVDLPWGNHEKKRGLEHIIIKHINTLHDFENIGEAMRVIDDVIKNGEIIKDKPDKIILQKDGNRVVVSKNVRDEKGVIIEENKNWVVTAYDKGTDLKKKQSSTSTFVPPESAYEGRAVTPDAVSDSKGRKNPTNTQGKGQRFSLPERDMERDDEYKRLADIVETSANPQEISSAKARMREILDEVKREKGYSDDSSYQGTSAFNGAAPSTNGYFETKEERKAAYDNGEFDGDASLGDFMDSGIDVADLEFTLHDPRSYRIADAMRRESIDNLRSAVDSGSKTITMYRSVPASVTEGEFRNGDWVTPSRAYAELNAEIHGWGNDYRIIEKEVSVDDVWWDGNDIAEWGYDNGRGEVYKNTENNRKSDDLITYDDNGNIILPSQRFNEGKSDVRFSLPNDVKLTKRERELRDGLIEKVSRAVGAESVITDVETGERVLDMLNGRVPMSRGKKRALETVVPGDETPFKATVVSNADGAKILQEVRNLAKKSENLTKGQKKSFLKDVAAALGAKRRGSASQYATFETKNGRIVTIRLADHNASTRNDAWAHLKSELYKDADLVSWVKERYPDLAGDENALAHELFAKFGGKRGTERLREEQAKAEAENKDGIVGKARIIAMFDHLKNMLAKYWQMARDLFAGNNTRLNDMSVNDFADMAMADLMHGTKPLDAANAKNKGGRNARSERSSRTGEDVEREAKANGTWLKAPNGAETNLEEKQWKDVRTDSFKGYFGDWERSYQKDSLMNAEPVSKLEAKKIIAREGQSFIDAVYELFEKQGGKANSPFGEVLLDKKGAKNDVKHGVGVEKNISFASVKDVLEKGIIILPLDYYGTSGKKQKTGIVAAPIAIDGKRYICAVEVIANKENSRLYVHEVFTTEKLHENVVSNQVRGSKTASPHSQGAIAKLLQEIVNSKDNSSKVVDENGEPLVVYHASPEHGFTTFKDNAFFSKNREYTDRYEKGGDTYEVYLNIRKPFDIRNPKDRKIFTEYRNGHEPARTKSGAMDWAEFDYYDKEYEEGLQQYLMDNYPNEYDGFILDEGADGGYGNDVKARGLSYVPFYPEQIKSATDNVGTFDRSNKDIRFSLPEEDRKVSSAHDAMSRKGLREIVGKEGYDAFLDTVGRRLRDDVKKEVSSSVGREFLDDVLGVATNAQHTERSGKSYEVRRRDAVGLTIGLLLERIW